MVRLSRLGVQEDSFTTSKHFDSHRDQDYRSLRLNVHDSRQARATCCMEEAESGHLTIFRKHAFNFLLDIYYALTSGLCELQIRVMSSDVIVCCKMAPRTKERFRGIPKSMLQCSPRATPPNSNDRSRFYFLLGKLIPSSMAGSSIFAC